MQSSMSAKMSAEAFPMGNLYDEAVCSLSPSPTWKMWFLRPPTRPAEDWTQIASCQSLGQAPTAMCFMTVLVRLTER